MHLSAIVAMSENRVIGKDNQLPWHLPADLRHFKEITMGKPILMGRKTHESIGRVLPGRLNIIMTRNTTLQVPNAWVIHTLDAAFEQIATNEEIMLIGGSELYRELLPQVQCIYMTIVHTEVTGDSYFPELNLGEWQEVSREAHLADEQNKHPYSFVLWHRKSPLLKK